MTEGSNYKSILELSREMSKNHLKDPSVAQIEQVISDCLTQLVGHEYRCSVSSLVFSDGAGETGATITLTATKDQSHLYE